MLNAYLDNFPNLESLEINSDPDGESYEAYHVKNMFTFLAFAQQYPNLKRLVIEGGTIIDQHDFNELLDCLPNLEIFKIIYKFKYKFKYLDACGNCYNSIN